MPPKRKVVEEVVEAKPAKRVQPSSLLSIPKRPNNGGTVFTFGTGENGQLGLGDDKTEIKKPWPISSLKEQVVDVQCGGLHTAVLTVTGKVFTCGVGDEGCLGRKNYSEDEDTFEFGAAEGITEDAVQVSAGDSHTLVLGASGTVFITGTFRDNSGCFGIDSQEPDPAYHETKEIDAKYRSKDRLRQFLFETVPLPLPAVQIASGSNHCVAILNDGSVYTWGVGEQGQLGRIGQRLSSRFNVRKTLLEPSVVTLHAKGRWAAVSVACGSYNTYLRVLPVKEGKVSLTDAAEILAFGLNNYGQLGVEGEEMIFKPTKSSLSALDIVHISSGQHHTVAVARDGKTYALGRSEYGRLGLGAGASDATEPTLVVSLNGEKAVRSTCGLATSGVLTENRDAFLWGMGGNLQVGRGGSDAEDDAEEPLLLQGGKFEPHSVLAVSMGGQHSAIVATKAAETPAK